MDGKSHFEICMEGLRKIQKTDCVVQEFSRDNKTNKLLVNDDNKVIKELGNKFDKYLHISLEDENHQLHCALINSRSVGNKAQYIFQLKTVNDLDLLVIAETWLFVDEKAEVSLITPNGYTTFSKSRAVKGGGVAVICCDQFKCFIHVNDFQSFEYFQLDVLVKNKRFSLFPVYRPELNTVSMDTFFLKFSFLRGEISTIAHEFSLSW